MQVSPGRHADPQAPQCAVSTERSAHTAPQLTSPASHAQTPEVHVCPAPQAMSQPPQCIASVVGSTHVAPQVIEPAPQMGEPESTIPVAPSIEASRPVEPSGGSLLLPQPAAPVSANAKKKKPERLQ